MPFHAHGGSGGSHGPVSTVNALFAQESGSAQGRGCTVEGEQRQCAYRLGDGLIRLVVTQAEGGWIVARVEVD